jgi:hypothetical protein
MLLAGTVCVTGRCHALTQVEGFRIAGRSRLRIATRAIGDDTIVGQAITGDGPVLYARMNKDHGGGRQFASLILGKLDIHRRLIEGVGLLAAQGSIKIRQAFRRTRSKLLSCVRKRPIPEFVFMGQSQIHSWSLASVLDLDRKSGHGTDSRNWWWGIISWHKPSPDGSDISGGGLSHLAVLESRYARINPGSCDSPFSNRAILAIFEILLLLASFKCLNYCITNIFDGPCDWRGPAILWIGCLPFVSGVWLFVYRAFGS